MAHTEQGLAQLVPIFIGTLPWHGRGHRFESDILHLKISSGRWDFFMYFSDERLIHSEPQIFP
jgi:hypothetical protein